MRCAAFAVTVVGHVQNKAKKAGHLKLYFYIFTKKQKTKQKLDDMC